MSNASGAVRMFAWKSGGIRRLVEAYWAQCGRDFPSTMLRILLLVNLVDMRRRHLATRPVAGGYRGPARR